MVIVLFYKRERVRVLLTLVPNGLFWREVVDPVHVFDFFIVVRIERVHIIDADVEDVIVLTVHQIASTMDAPPKMFVGAAILRVHALQDTVHMNARLTAPHTDCGIQSLPRELEFGMDGMYPKHTLEMQFAGGMITQTHHTPPVFLAFPDPGTEFSGFLDTSLLRHLADHTFETVLLGPLLLNDVPDGIAPTLSPLSTLVFVDDLTDGVTENLPAGFDDPQRSSSFRLTTHGDGLRARMQRSVLYTVGG